MDAFTTEEPSNAGPTEEPEKTGLAGYVYALIAIGISLLVIFAILIVLLIRHQRKKFQRELDTEDDAESRLQHGSMSSKSSRDHRSHNHKRGADWERRQHHADKMRSQNPAPVPYWTWGSNAVGSYLMWKNAHQKKAQQQQHH